MTLFHVQPGGYQSLKVYSPRLGRTLAFVDGVFSTSDADEIRVLRRNRYCRETAYVIDVPDEPEDDPEILDALNNHGQDDDEDTDE